MFRGANMKIKHAFDKKKHTKYITSTINYCWNKCVFNDYLKLSRVE